MSGTKLISGISYGFKQSWELFLSRKQKFQMVILGNISDCNLNIDDKIFAKTIILSNCNHNFIRTLCTIDHLPDSETIIFHQKYYPNFLPIIGSKSVFNKVGTNIIFIESGDTNILANECVIEK